VFPKCAGALIIALWLFGCGDARRDEMPAADLETIDPTGQEVVFWYQHTRMREDALVGMIADFNRTNGFGIKVMGEYAGQYSDIYNKMVVGLQGGELPELVVAYQNQAQAYHRADGLVDIKPYMDSAKWGLSTEARDDFLPAFLAQDDIGGVQIGFPPNRSMEVLYYNQDWLEELGYEKPPRTWAEFATLCRKARTQPFSRSPTPNRSLGFLLDTDASRAASMTMSRGGTFMDAATTYTLNTPEFRAALTLMQELISDGSVELLSERYGDTTEFSIGTVLFALRSSSGLPFVKSGVETGEGFEWRVTSPPFDGDRPVVNVYGASISICRTTAQQQLAAWLFLKWFTEPEQQARWVRASNYFPVRQSTANQLGDYFAENPNYERAFHLLSYGKSEPTVVSYEAVRKLISDAIVETADGADVGTVLTALEIKANDLAAQMQ
jgi:multiple sugar transport system substrate-binding protein